MASVSPRAYTCPLHHFSVTIPVGWTTDTSFDTANAGFCNKGGYTSPDFVGTAGHSALFYLSSWIVAPGDAKAALRDEIRINHIQHAPSSFSTIRTSLGVLTTASFVSTAKSPAHHLKNAYHWLLASTCFQKDCTVFVGLLDTRVPTHTQAALLRTLDQAMLSFHILQSKPPTVPKITITTRFPISKTAATGVVLVLAGAQTDKGNPVDHLSNGTIYVVIHVTLLNSGRFTLPYNYYDFQLISRTSKLRYPRAGSTKFAQTIRSGKLTKGAKVSGDLLFAVPVSAGKLDFVWEPPDSSDVFDIPLN
jgi:hypothetical protein